MTHSATKFSNNIHRVLSPSPEHYTIRYRIKLNIKKKYTLESINSEIILCFISNSRNLLDFKDEKKHHIASSFKCSDILVSRRN